MDALVLDGSIPDFPLQVATTTACDCNCDCELIPLKVTIVLDSPSVTLTYSMLTYMNSIRKQK